MNTVAAMLRVGPTYCGPLVSQGLPFFDFPGFTGGRYWQPPKPATYSLSSLNKQRNVVPRGRELGALGPAAQRITDLLELPEDWNGQGSDRPNMVAARSCLAVIRLLGVDFSDYSRLVPSAEGGLAIVFFSGDTVATIECFNDGEIVVGISSPGQPPEVSELPPNRPEHGLERLRERLSPQSRT